MLDSVPASRRLATLRRQYIAYGLVVALLLVLPLFLSDFRLALVGKYLAFAVAAVGLDLLWGYAGVLSLGHAVFFSLGAYSMAMHMKLQSEALPDFMVWSGLEQLPWFWEPFRHFAFALPMAVVIPAAFAIIIGYPTFRSGIRGVYFSILTQAMALAMSILLIGQQPFTGRHQRHHQLPVAGRHLAVQVGDAPGPLPGHGGHPGGGGRAGALAGEHQDRHRVDGHSRR